MDFSLIWAQYPRPGAMLLKFHQEIRSLRNIIDYAILDVGMQVGIPFAFLSNSKDDPFTTYPTLYPEEFMDTHDLAKRYQSMQENGLFNARNYPIRNLQEQYETRLHLRPLMHLKEVHADCSINFILMPEAEELQSLQDKASFQQIDMFLDLSTSYIDRYYDWRRELQGIHFYDQVHLNSSGQRAFGYLIAKHILSLPDR